ncbi:MAG: diaminopimelate decarboxylase [Deltaproteobacteria bacterium]
MFVSESLSVNGKGHLEIGGCDCIELASQYGTPLYVMDEELIRKNCRAFKSSLDKFYDGDGMVLYASKAFCSLYICKIIKEEGLGLDVVSGGELYTAIKAGFPADKIYFHGNNKTLEEIQLALDNNIGRIIVDNIEELERINLLAQRKGIISDVSFRIKPGIEAHTHEFIKTGQIDSKFGFALETGEAVEIIEKASKLKNINVIGLHCHIGSQIFDVNPFVEAAEVMMNFIFEIKQRFGIIIKELNLGGGFGIKYTSEQEHEKYENFLEAASGKIKDAAKEKGIDIPKILIEPGRSIVGSAGITLYTVGSVKEIPGIRKYVSIDGGMSDNPRYILYQAEYEVVSANKANEPKDDVITLAGKCCESGDLIGEGMKLQMAEVGDIIAVMSTGAYNYSMSSNYNRIPRPAVVMVNKGTHKVIVNRETYEDLIRNDI